MKKTKNKQTKQTESNEEQTHTWAALMERPNWKWSQKIYRRSSLKASQKTVIFDFMVNPNNNAKQNKQKKKATQNCYTYENEKQ